MSEQQLGDTNQPASAQDESSQDQSSPEAKQQSNGQSSASTDKQTSKQPSGEEAPSMNVFEAIGVALFKGVDDSKINHPGPGELKRSFRLTRLLVVIALAILSFVIVIALLAHPLMGWAKLLGVLVFLAFTVRCGYVAMMLWRKLK